MRQQQQRRLKWTHVLAVMMTAAALVGVAPAPARAATPAQVNESIKKAVEYLYKIQKDGNWEVSPKGDPNGFVAGVTGVQWGGPTAMATYALLAAGERPTDPRVMKGLEFLIKADMIGTYAVALRAQCWTFIPEQHPLRPQIRKAIKRDMEILLGGLIKDQGKDSHGFYSYTKGAYEKGGNGIGAGHYDRSNSQYGVLGVWALAEAGGEVPVDYWKTIDAAWKKCQNTDGGFNYNPHHGGGASTGTMTPAGLATLFITLDYLGDKTGACKGNDFNKNIEMAMGWIDRQVVSLMGGNYYAMYGVERVGVASGRKYFGKTDWYAVGADWLVKNQGGDGSWGAPEEVHNPKGIPSTCWSLFFLTRGRAPVVMNKLEWRSVTKEGKESGWNQRPRDVANFAKWMSKNLDGRYINWQIVHLKGNVDDLHDSSILYMAGSEGFGFGKEDAEKLRRFVEDGGLLLGNADCGKGQFANSFRKLGKQLFPTYEFRDLPPNHPIFNGQQFKATKWRQVPKVLGLSNGARELMILLPDADPAKAWQMRNDSTKTELFQIAANISLYSTGGLTDKYKGDTHLVKDLGKQPAATVRVARLQAGDNPNPEPAGWRRLNAVLRNANQATLSDFDKLVKPTDNLKDYPVAHLTGTTKFTLDDKAKAALKAYVAGGGTLILESAGGVNDFADAANAAVTAIWPEAAKKQLANPVDIKHELYANPAAPIEALAYRKFARARMGARTKVPRLRAMDTNGDGRLDVFVSNEDMSVGMVGHEVDGIVGYTPDSATAVMRNIILYAMKGKGAAPVAAAQAAPAPAAQPAPVQK